MAGCLRQLQYFYITLSVFLWFYLSRFSALLVVFFDFTWCIWLVAFCNSSCRILKSSCCDFYTTWRLMPYFLWDEQSKVCVVLYRLGKLLIASAIGNNSKLNALLKMMNYNAYCTNWPVFKVNYWFSLRFYTEINTILVFKTSLSPNREHISLF